MIGSLRALPRARKRRGRGKPAEVAGISAAVRRDPLHVGGDPLQTFSMRNPVDANTSRVGRSSARLRRTLCRRPDRLYPWPARRWRKFDLRGGTMVRGRRHAISKLAAAARGTRPDEVIE